MYALPQFTALGSVFLAYPTRGHSPRAVWDQTIPTYPLIFQQAGYHIGYTYKVWSPGRPADAPYGSKATGYETAGIWFNQFVTGKDNQQAAKQLLPEEELYDLRIDRNQVRNVADRRHENAVKAEFSQRLIQVLTETHDPRVTGDGSTFDRLPFTNLA